MCVTLGILILIPTGIAAESVQGNFCFVSKQNGTEFVKKMHMIRPKTMYTLYNFVYRCTVHSDIRTVHLPTDARLLKL